MKTDNYFILYFCLPIFFFLLVLQLRHAEPVLVLELLMLPILRFISKLSKYSQRLTPVPQKGRTTYSDCRTMGGKSSMHWVRCSIKETFFLQVLVPTRFCRTHQNIDSSNYHSTIFISFSFIEQDQNKCIGTYSWKLDYSMFSYLRQNRVLKTVKYLHFS